MALQEQLQVGPFQFSEVLIQFLALFIAIFAAAQPWLVEIWRSQFRKGKIEIYPTVWIQIGYVNVGPTVRLVGALRAVDREQFVQGISLKVVKLSNGATNRFEWRFFNVDMLSYGGTNPRQELPLGFMVAPVQAHRYDITFSDPEYETRKMLPVTRPLWDTWSKDWLPQQTDLVNSAIAESDNWKSSQSLIPRITQRLQEQFLRTQHFTDATSELQRISFWDDDTYRITMEVHTANLKKAASFEQSIELTADEAAALRGNADLIGMNAFGYTLPRTLYFVDKRLPSNWDSKSLVSPSQT